MAAQKITVSDIAEGPSGPIPNAHIEFVLCDLHGKPVVAHLAAPENGILVAPYIGHAGPDGHFAVELWRNADLDRTNTYYLPKINRRRAPIIAATIDGNLTSLEAVEPGELGSAGAASVEALAAEVANRIAGDTTLATDLADEVTDRAAADSALASALADETAARQDADTTLATELDQAVTDLEAEIAGLNLTTTFAELDDVTLAGQGSTDGVLIVRDADGTVRNVPTSAVTAAGADLATVDTDTGRTARLTLSPSGPSSLTNTDGGPLFGQVLANAGAVYMQAGNETESKTVAVVPSGMFIDGDEVVTAAVLQAALDAAVTDLEADLATGLAGKSNVGHTHALADLTGTVSDAQIPASITRDSELSAAISVAIDVVVGGAPGTLNALNELAAAIGNDPNFAATVAASIATKVSKSTYDAHSILVANVDDTPVPITIGEGEVPGRLVGGQIASLTAANLRTLMSLGSAALAASTDFQPVDPDLTAIAALTTSTIGRSLLAIADAAAGRTVLGLGALAVLATVGTAQIDNDAITNAKLANMATKTYRGRHSAGTGDPEDVAPVDILADLSGAAGAAFDWAAQRQTNIGAATLKTDSLRADQAEQVIHRTVGLATVYAVANTDQSILSAPAAQPSPIVGDSWEYEIFAGLNNQSGATRVFSWKICIGDLYVGIVPITVPTTAGNFAPIVIRAKILYKNSTTVTCLYEYQISSATTFVPVAASALLVTNLSSSFIASTFAAWKISTPTPDVLVNVPSNVTISIQVTSAKILKTSF